MSTGEGLACSVPCRPYERPEVQEALGRCLRPGGLPLTLSALARCMDRPGARTLRTPYILDVGCGLGTTVAHLRSVLGHAAFGLDLSAGLLAQARTASIDQADRMGRTGQAGTSGPLSPPIPLIPLMRGRAEALPVRDQCLDGLLYECALSLADDPGVCLDEAQRALASGGWLVCSDLYRRDRPWGPERSSGGSADARDCLQGAGRMNGLPTALAERGFSVILLEDHSRLLAEAGARLVLAGLSMAELFPGADCPDCRGRSAYGYFLLVARKENEEAQEE